MTQSLFGRKAPPLSYSYSTSLAVSVTGTVVVTVSVTVSVTAAVTVLAAVSSTVKSSKLQLPLKPRFAVDVEVAVSAVVAVSFTGSCRYQPIRRRHRCRYGHLCKYRVVATVNVAATSYLWSCRCPHRYCLLYPFYCWMPYRKIPIYFRYIVSNVVYLSSFLFHLTFTMNETSMYLISKSYLPDDV